MTVSASDPLLLKGLGASITKEDRAQAVWILKKVTSLTYIRRMNGLFANFVGGYEDWVRHFPSLWAEENLVEFLRYRTLLEKGIEQILASYKSGYMLVAQGCNFFGYLTGGRFEHEFQNEEIGFRSDGNHVGLYAWARKALDMAWRTQNALHATWGYPGLLMFNADGLPSPKDAGPAPRPQGAVVHTGSDVPTSGIWAPLAPHACEAYLIEGGKAPTSRRPSRHMRAYPYVEYEDAPDSWRLVWEDDRYPKGQVPDEAAYLDPATEPPPWPPVHPQPVEN